MDNPQIADNPLLNPVGEPRSIADFMAIKDGATGNYESLGTKKLAFIYGIAHLPGHEDPEAISKIDEMLNTKSADPVSAKFVFGYTLGSDFYEQYSVWKRNQVVDKPAQEQLGKKILEWMIEGIKKYPENAAFQKAISNISGRIPHDTFIGDPNSSADPPEILALEEAAGRKLDLAHDIYKQTLINQTFEKWQEFRAEKNETESKSE